MRLLVLFLSAFYEMASIRTRAFRITRKELYPVSPHFPLPTVPVL
ncbi:hypothetical protein [Pyrobaculum aerophilum]|nr:MULTISPECIES: hypothetical protein [Pyrobaculum]